MSTLTWTKKAKTTTWKWASPKWGLRWGAALALVPYHLVCRVCCPCSYRLYCSFLAFATCSTSMSIEMVRGVWDRFRLAPPPPLVRHCFTATRSYQINTIYKRVCRHANCTRIKVMLVLFCFVCFNLMYKVIDNKESFFVLNFVCSFVLLLQLYARLVEAIAHVHVEPQEEI